MAKARDIEALQCDMPYARAAAHIVAVRAQELFAHADGVLDVTDIERVHDMRVATRRLRAVLEIFAPCFPAGEHKAVLRDVKRLADALGARRDPDVQLAALERFEQATAKADAPGIEAFAERLREEQAAANAALAAALAEAEADELEERLERLVAAAEGVVEAPDAEAPVAEAPGAEPPEAEAPEENRPVAEVPVADAPAAEAPAA
jgi:CHAD domain-containing protein